MNSVNWPRSYMYIHSEIGISLLKCLLKYKSLLKYLFTFHMLSIFKEFDNENFNFKSIFKYAGEPQLSQ